MGKVFFLIISDPVSLWVGQGKTGAEQDSSVKSTVVAADVGRRREKEGKKYPQREKRIECRRLHCITFPSSTDRQLG